MKTNFYNSGQSLIGIIIVLVIVGLLGGGFYVYLSKQIPEIPEITEKPAEENVIESGEEVVPEKEVTPEKKVENKPAETAKEIEVGTPKITCRNECSSTALKRCSANAYESCGNYDADTCLEWGLTTNCPQNTICQNGGCVQQKCSDGTLYGQCSANKPKYCENGNLVDNPSRCGSLSSGKSCSTITTESDLGIIDVTTCKLQTKGQINVGVIEFAPQNVVYGNVSYANLKSLSSCPSLCSKTGYFWINGLNASNACYDVINKYSFLDLFNNSARSISKYVECQTYNIAQSGNEILHSVSYIKDWWEREAAKYGATGFSMNIDVKGPYTLSSDPPAGGRWGSEGACNDNLKQFFINQAKNNGVEENNYDIIVYIYLDDWQLSKRTYQGFTSCVDMSNQKIFADVPTNSYPLETDNIVMLIHEVGHTLGSLDYYTSPCSYNSKYQSCAKEPEGIPEPNKVPKYPQTKACIMAQGIQTADPRTSLMPPTDALFTPDLAVLCDAAAKEIEWK